MPDLTTPWSVVCFAGIDWDYNRQRPQWVMSSLADRGASVLYVDNLGTRMPRLRDAPRVARRLGSWLRSSTGPTPEVYPGIRRDAPLVPALSPRPFARALSKRILARRVRSRAGARRPLVVWTYLPLPAIADVAEEMRADLLVYDWSDDASEHMLYATQAHRERIARWEHEMLERADLAFVASAELLRRRGSPNLQTTVIPHGMPPVSPRPPLPLELAAMPGPRIGLIGNISEWVDLELLEGLARARPDWSFVLVGPMQTSVAGLRRLPNVLFTGRQDHGALDAYLSAFDVGLICYKLTPATTVASPVKLREYLAHGLPIVSVDLPEVRPFTPRVSIASDVDGFVDAIGDALETGRHEDRHWPSWDHRVDRMVALADERLAKQSHLRRTRPRLTGTFG